MSKRSIRDIYSINPLCIALLNPFTGKHIRAFFFLGNLPTNVYEAILRGEPTSDPRKLDWHQKDQKIIRSHYGNDWRNKLTARDPPSLGEFQSSSNPLRIFSGGLGAGVAQEKKEPKRLDDFDDFDDLGSFEEISEKWPELEEHVGETKTGPSGWTPPPTIGPPIYSTTSIYPEDTIYDLRLKLNLISEIPFYRQHFFYYMNGEGPVVPYNITLEHVPVAIDWQAFMGSTLGSTPSPIHYMGDPMDADPERHKYDLDETSSDSDALYWEGALEAEEMELSNLPGWEERTFIQKAVDARSTMLGVPIDRSLEERREAIRVEVRDFFTLLSPMPSIRMTRAYLIDLHQVIPPLIASERPNDQLASILKDPYQFDLLYYGGLLKFWPHLTPDLCNIALKDPYRIASLSPLLDPDPASLKNRFKQEQELIDRALLWQAGQDKESSIIQRNNNVAVTSASIRLAPLSTQMQINIRNVLDWIPTSCTILAMGARFEIPSGKRGQMQGECGLQRRGRKDVAFVVKRHISSYGPAISDEIETLLSRTLKKGDLSIILSFENPRSCTPNTISKKMGIPALPISQRKKFSVMLIHSDGYCEVLSSWREDDRMEFDMVIQQLGAFIDPIIHEINAMGSAGFPMGGRLTPFGTKKQTGEPEAVVSTLGTLTAMTFWPHSLTASEFKDMKTRFRPYEKAGIVRVLGLQQGGAYTFAFNKGIVAYNPKLLEKFENFLEKQEGTDNSYLWLVNPALHARWASNFGGRIVRIYHRATDLKVEISGADTLEEFERIRRYVFSFLDSLLEGPNPLTGETRGVGEEKEARTSAQRRLRRLQEQDPQLFDLKKYDQASTVYSVLCQSGRQPYVYTEQEFQSLPLKKQKELIKFWNFTESKPAFYSCPNPEYPHLSFRAGEHPLGYCLPCCKKTLPLVGSRTALINDECLKHHLISDAVESGSSLHILAYGKSIPLGRMAHPPREVEEGFLLDAIPPPYKFVLLGVEQEVPSIPGAGFAFALATIAGEAGESTEEVFITLADTAENLKDSFYTLAAGGGGLYFSSSADLADTIRKAFIFKEEGFSPFGPGGWGFGYWKAILIDLVRFAYGIEIIELIHLGGDAHIRIEVLPETSSTLLKIARERDLGDAISSETSNSKLGLIVTGPSGSYPLVATHPKLFLRTPEHLRWMVLRRIFEIFPLDIEEIICDKVLENVCKLVSFNFETSETTQKILDLSFVQDFVTKFGVPGSPSYVLEVKLINMRNLCYGLILRDRDASKIYIPIIESPFLADGVPIKYGARPVMELSPKKLIQIVSDINRFIADFHQEYIPIVPTATLMDREGRSVGFASGPNKTLNALYSSPYSQEYLYFFHDPLPSFSEGGEDPQVLPTILIPYDLREVDEEIVAWVRGRRLAGSESQKGVAEKSRLKNELYTLFLSEFAKILHEDRNEDLRTRFMEAIDATSFESATSVADLREQIVSIFVDHPDDVPAIRNIVSRSFVQTKVDPKQIIKVSLEASIFGFDYRLLQKLQQLSTHQEVVSALQGLMEERLYISDSVDTGIGNIYTTCGESSSIPKMHCKDGRLALSNEKAKDFFDLLASDVRNPLKSKSLSIFSAGFLKALRFIKRADERIEIISVCE